MRLIDADALIERLLYCFYEEEKVSISSVTGTFLTEFCSPTIEAEPVRHGKWIGLEYDGYADGSPVYDLWECSECHMEHEGEEDTLTDYCPHCGAKMDLEEATDKCDT